MSPHIIVVGLTRSGTTFVTNLLAKTGEFHVEIEPHVLWKSGNFKYLNDEQYDATESIARHINRVLTQGLGDKRMLEKSPINALRPHLVYKAFPNAKIVYIERDPIRCINSNYIRSLNNDSFKPSLTLRKYFYKSGGDKGLENAVSSRTIFSQMKWGDIIFFMRYVLYMVTNRTIAPKDFPFGPKLKNFKSFIKKQGILSYHVKVFKLAQEQKEVFLDLYQQRIQLFKLEKLMSNPSELKRLYDWSEVSYTEREVNETISSIDQKRIIKATNPSEIDKSIMQLMHES